jgi:hypothetical protein
MGKAKRIEDYLKDADEAARNPAKDSGRGRRTADKGRAAAAQGTGDPAPNRHALERDPTKTGIRRPKRVIDPLLAEIQSHLTPTGRLRRKD